MKRYLLFRYDQYYPAGAPTEYKGQFDTLEEVKEYIDQKDFNYDYSWVLDINVGEWIPIEETDIYK